MTINFSLLNDSIELFTRQEEGARNPYVASPISHAIYSATTWAATRSRVFHFFCSEGSEDRALLANISHFQTLFRQAVEEMRTIDARFRAACVNNNLPNMPELRASIITTGEALFSFFNPLEGNSCLERIRKIERAIFPILGHPLFQPAEEEILEKFEEDYACAALEGIIKKPLPRLAIINMTTGRPTSSIERKDIDEWIHEVEGHQEVFCRLVHIAIKGVLSLETFNSGEKLLVEKGLKTLEQEEPIYTRWFRSLVPGMEIGNERLGRPVFFRAFSNFGFSLFERAANPTELIVIGKTPSRVGLWQACRDDEIGSVNSFRASFLARDGRYCIIPKPAKCLDEIEWKSHFARVVEEDEAYLDPVASLLLALAQSSKIPYEIDPSSLFFTKKKKLYSSASLALVSPHNFSTLEKFCLDVSKRNFLIFRYLMRRAHLHEHPAALFSYEMVKKALQKEESPFSLEDEAALRKIEDSQICAKAKKAVEEAKLLQDKFFYAFFERLITKDQEGIRLARERVGSALLKIHKDVGALPTLWQDESFVHTFVERTLSELIE
jgi:hypothetical protein